MDPDIRIPLDLVTGELFVQLYAHGYTASAPDIAAEIVFGDTAPPGIAERVDALLRRAHDRRNE